MSTIQDAPRTETESRRFASLTDDARRRIVEILRDSTGTVAERELAERVAAATQDTETTSDEVESHLIRLHHVHLPKLADAGLVDWDREARAVAAADRLADDDAQTEDRSSVAAGLDESHREVLSLVRSATGTVARADLARDLASPAADEQSAEPSVEDIEVQLHHRYLPKLEDAGLVEYDTEDGTVEYSD